MALSISQKINRGIDLLEDASNDQDLLGVALLAFHAALTDYLSTLLASQPERQDSGEQQALPVADMLDIAQQHGDLTREQRWRIEDADKLAREFIAGESFRGSPREVRSYGHFVATLSGDTQNAEYLVSAPKTQPTAEQFDQDEQPESTLYQGVMRWLPGLALLAILLAGGLWLFSRAANPSSSNVAAVPTARGRLLPQGTALPAQLTPNIPILPSPVLPAGARIARIVRLGGGPGWLHESPAFDSPTLPIRLSEGQQVIVFDQQQQDADGNPWVLVSISSYQGWSPLNNIEYIAP